MGEKEITDIASNKAIMLAESRVRCIVDNAKCILKASLNINAFASFTHLVNTTCNRLFIVLNF